MIKKKLYYNQKLIFKSSPPLVLEGVTGSGKNRSFFEAVESVIKKNSRRL